jgi:hypothetical protein
VSNLKINGGGQSIHDNLAGQTFVRVSNGNKIEKDDNRKETRQKKTSNRQKETRSQDAGREVRVKRK